MLHFARNIIAQFQGLCVIDKEIFQRNNISKIIISILLEYKNKTTFVETGKKNKSKLIYYAIIYY